LCQSSIIIIIVIIIIIIIVLSSTAGKTGSKRVVIMDEVDGMSASDRGGTQELIKMIKTSKIPIICICNDRYSQKVKSECPRHHHHHGHGHPSGLITIVPSG
jgi:DNA polymerase III delta prime subunit